MNRCTYMPDVALQRAPKMNWGMFSVGLLSTVFWAMIGTEDIALQGLMALLGTLICVEEIRVYRKKMKKFKEYRLNLPQLD